MYVRSPDAGKSRVVVGPRPPRAVGVVARGWTWTGEAADRTERLSAQVRYRHIPVAAHVAVETGGRARVEFEQPVVAATPGQAVVLYRGDTVVGGGWIAATLAADVE